MSGDIFIKDLKGIEKTIAQMCDLNKDGKLHFSQDQKKSEVSIFQNTCLTIKDSTFTFGGVTYDSKGNAMLLSKTSNQDIFVPEQKEKPAQMPDLSDKLPKAPIEINDATRVAKPAVPYRIKRSTTLKPPKNIGIGNDIRTNYAWSEKELNDAIEGMTVAKKYNGKFKKSILRGKAHAFIKSAQKNHVDPRAIIAIAMHESERGISMAHRNNVGGSSKDYKSVEDSIEEIAQTLRSNCDSGRITLNSIAFHYTKSKSSTPGWKSGVGSYLSQLNSLYRP